MINIANAPDDRRYGYALCPGIPRLDTWPDDAETEEPELFQAEDDAERALAAKRADLLVRVVYKADTHGEIFNGRVLEDICGLRFAKVQPKLTLDEQVEWLFDVGPNDFTCFLAEDWCFDAISKEADRSLGHSDSGIKFDTIAEIIVAGINDLEQAFLRTQPRVDAVALFWNSWQTKRYIAQFCRKLALSETARQLFRRAPGPLEASLQEVVRQGDDDPFLNSLTVEQVDLARVRVLLLIAGQIPRPTP